MYTVILMKTYTLTASEVLIRKIEHVYEDEIVDKPIPYGRLFIKTEGASLTVYTSKKIVIQGPNADQVLQIIEGLSDERLAIKTAETKSETNKVKTASQYSTFFAHAGSDEVGTGDYFGPIVVCAAYIDSENGVSDLPIRDSKQMTDDLVMTLAPTLMERFKYSVLILDNVKYNQMHQRYNMNQLKAILHNQAYIHLYKKLNFKPKSIIDQFTPETSYYRYLQDQKEIIKPLTFETKAESKYLGVAIAAIIARYHFLISLQKLEETFQIKLVKGASAAVDQAAVEIIKKHGMQTLAKVAKMHFKNTEKAKEMI